MTQTQETKAMTPSINRREFAAATLAALTVLTPAFAQDTAFPSKPIKVIVPHVRVVSFTGGTAT